MSDDLSMKALDGPLDMRAKHALLAGCDLVLHCNGDMAEMVEIAAEVKPLEGVHARRADAALAHLVVPEAFDRAAAEARLAQLLEGAA
jgi:beta-N-acetylhexosaminidase